MLLYTVLVFAILMYSIPYLIKKPTGIEFIDNIVLYTNTNQQFILAASILVGLSVFLTQKYLVQATGDF
jgi:hypothetical protein